MLWSDYGNLVFLYKLTNVNENGKVCKWLLVVNFPAVY
jgi:hypothetical protein